jgi:hypothetical protein
MTNEDEGSRLLRKLRERAAQPGYVKPDYSHLDDPGFYARIDAAMIEANKAIEAETWAEMPDEPPERPTRKPPRLDPVKSAAKMIAKNPELVARIKPGGEIEIASKASSSSSDDIELDARVGTDVMDAIERIRGGGHGRH